MDPFAFYGIKRMFFLDSGALRRSFLEKSRLFHPDHMAGSLASAQEKALEISGFNNLAYETLKDFHKRLRCILSLEGFDLEDSQSSAPTEFLMAMMELNEGLMELQFDPDPVKREALTKELTELEQDILKDATPIMEAYDRGESVDLKTVQDYYLKHRYVIRSLENLEKTKS